MHLTSVRIGVVMFVIFLTGCGHQQVKQQETQVVVAPEMTRPIGNAVAEVDMAKFGYRDY